MTTPMTHPSSSRRDRPRGAPIRVLAIAFVATFALLASFAGRAGAAGPPFLVGVGKSDITGPAVGVQMFGFVRADQVTEGVHTRLSSRAFLVADAAAPDARIAFVVADLGSVTVEMHREVVDRLKKRFGDAYRLENTIVSATHTHSGPGGFWHWGANTIIGGPFYKKHFDAICEGIVESIARAHASLRPGRIRLARGEVEGAGANRSLVAYMNNPAEERALYPHDTDREMTLLRLDDAKGPVGAINWFAVHPTAMTFFNRLISGDHKGAASDSFEERFGAGAGNPGFVAAFAQTNCGDVTPNLNLDNTGPGADQFETTRIIADRQIEVAARLFETAEEVLAGPVAFRQGYVDFSGAEVSDEFSRAGPVATCPSAYGYSFAAGSTEDGGGHPLFKEGMTKRNPMIDGMIGQFAPIPTPTDELRAKHAPKVILFAPGGVDPPMLSQIVPVSVVRIGSLALVAGPGEYTTMAGRRIRETVRKKAGEWAKHVVIAGYSNGFFGYVTTFEEYQTQQYEGGHTIFGPWTLAAYQQEFARLAGDLTAGVASNPGPVPVDPRETTPSTELGTGHDLPLPEGVSPGDVSLAPRESYKPGETVEVAFRSGDPSNDYRTGGTYLEVRRNAGGAWTKVATDAAWETKVRWRDPMAPVPTATPQTIALAPPPRMRPSEALLEWTIPADAEPGEYRIVHFGVWTAEGEKPKRFEAASPTFRVER